MPTITVFDNGAYVDTAGTFADESDTVQATLALQGHTVSTYTATDAAGTAAALAGQAVVVIPELENIPPLELTSFIPDPATAAVYQSFVANGGTMVIHGYEGDQAAFINAVFGFSVAEGGIGLGTTNLNGVLPPDLAGATLPATLPGNSGTEGLSIASLPPGAQVIYSSGDNATVVRIPVGDGYLIFVGWDWFDGAPLGQTDGGWLGVYDAVIDASTLPVAVDDVFDVPGADEDSGASIAVADLLANDSDPNGDPLTFVLVSPTSAGGADVSAAGGTVTYAPGAAYQYLGAGETAVDSFTYTISDGLGGSDSATVSVTVHGQNDAIQLLGAQMTGTGQEAGFDAAGNVLSAPNPTGQISAVDPDQNDTLGWTVLGGGAGLYGTLSVDQTGRWTFAVDQVATNFLALGESVQDVFTVRVSDGNGSIIDTPVTITINGANDNPTILSGPTTLDVIITELPDGAAGENTAIRGANGLVFFDDADTSNTHSVTYTPLGIGYLGAFNITGIDQGTDVATWNLSMSDADLNSLGEGETRTQQYQITVTDNDGGSTSYMVTALLVGSDDAAILSSDTATIVQSAVPGTASGDLDIIDEDGPDTFQVQPGTAGAYGTFSVDANGQWSYVASSAFTGLNAGETLTDTFVVLASDGTPTSVTVNIVGIDDDSTARPDFFTTDEATPVGGNLLADNGAGPDADPDDNLTVTRINGQPFTPGSPITLDSGALLTVNSDGTFTYDPNDAFNSLTAVPGTSNQRDFDTFTYQLSDGSGAPVQIQINGLNSPEDVLIGYTGVDNIIIGTPGPDRFFLQYGGNDQAYGLAGDDGFYLGAALTGLDLIDGGPDTDSLAIQGNYPGLTLGAIANVEVLVSLSGSIAAFGDTANNRYDYGITTLDSNVAAGAILTVQADTLLPGEDLQFDGSAETDGAFRIFAGQGSDELIGGAGNDGFFFGADGNLAAGDRVDGNGGIDSLALRGNYVGAGAVTFEDATMVDVETMVFLSGLTNEFGGAIDPAGFDYDITLADGNVAAGEELAVIALNLAAMESLSFDGSAESDGYFRILSGAGDDRLTGGDGDDLIFGGDGADVLDGGGGADRYLYTATSQSTAAAMDQVILGAGDVIDLATIDANGNEAGNGAFSWIGAGAFTGVAGEMRATNVGNVWTVEGDADGDGLADFVLQVTSLTPLTGGEFIL